MKALTSQLKGFQDFAKTTVTVSYNQAQFQWRGNAPFGDWSYKYMDYSTSGDYILTGKVLHTAWDYSPAVTDQTSASTVYVYDKATEF